MPEKRLIDAVALYEQIAVEVSSMLKQPPGIIVSKIMAMVLQAPTVKPEACQWRRRLRPVLVRKRRLLPHPLGGMAGHETAVRSKVHYPGRC